MKLTAHLWVIFPAVSSILKLKLVLGLVFGLVFGLVWALDFGPIHRPLVG